MRKNTFLLAAWQLTCWLGLVQLLIVSTPAGAQVPALPALLKPAAGQPLRTALNPDGTLRPGAQGVFDPRGYELLTTPDGRPAFRPRSTTQPGSLGGAARLNSTGGDWQPGFGLAGAAGYVSAMAEGPGGKLYVGFGTGAVDTIIAHGIACYDGTTWSPLGGGISGQVMAVAVTGADVYVGGNFTQAGGQSAQNVAHWDGTAWHALSTGINGWVSCLTVAGSLVYAGGTFTQAGGVAARNIACWNGTAWSALGAGTDTTVKTMAVVGTDLYVAGNSFLLRWNGAGWSPLGGGTDGYVKTLLADGPNLYVGGNFGGVYDSTGWGGYVPGDDLARWDGTRWHPIGSPNSFSLWGVELIRKVGATIYTVFEEANGFSIYRTTTAGAFIGSNLISNTVKEIAGRGTEVYAGGWITATWADSAGYPVNVISACGLTRWDGNRWAPLPTGCNGTVSSMVINGNEVYVGGSFTQIGNIAANGVARWDGATWHALGNGVTGPYASWEHRMVNAMTFWGNELYVSGDFTRAGGQPATGLARWDGTQWHPIASLAASSRGASYIAAMAINGSNLYVGGEFGLPGAPDAGLARWNGATWHQLPGVTGSASALLVHGTDLYAGGRFILPGGTRHQVIRWDGAVWYPVDTGTTFLNINCLAFLGATLYAGGNSGVLRSAIGRWDGTAWRNVGDGFNDEVYALSVSGSKLYAGGAFTASGTTPMNRLAVWNDTTWQAVGAGLNNTVFALATTPTTVYAGGWFSMLADSSMVSAAFAAYYPVGGTLRVNGFAPVSGLVGSTVVVTGLHLNSTTTVLFNGVPATGFTVNAAGTQLTVVVPPGATTGLITVVGGAGPVSSAASFRVEPNGLPETLPVASLVIYPNPAHHEVNICLAPLPGGMTTIPAELFDAQGRVVCRTVVSIGENRLPLRGLAPGFYALRVGRELRHLVVE